MHELNRGVKRRIESWLIVLSVAVCWLAAAAECLADTAEVLPQGKSAVYVEGKFYRPIEKKYGPTGKTEDIAEEYNTNLNSGVFPGLGQLEAALGLPAGFASLGETKVSYEYNVTIVEFNYAYGLTDRLSFAVKVPYWHFNNNVNAELDPTNATFGKNQFFGLAPPPVGSAPFLPLAAPYNATPLNTNDVQNLLGKGLDVNGDGTIDVPGYGYKKVKDWTKDSISDIQAGFRYQYYRSSNWRLAATAGVQFPTGREDDPDSLVDYSFGSGTWAGLFRLHQDFVGVKNLFLSSTLRYDWYLPDRNYIRVPDSVDEPLTRNKERVHRDIGDFFELELIGAYEFLEGLSFVLTYKYGYKWKNSVSGDRGYDYDSVEAETSQKAQEYTVGFEYSTIPMYMANKFPVPIKAFVGYRNRFEGENVLKSDYIDVGLTVYF